MYLEQYNLKGKTAFISGGAGSLSIGHACMEALLEAGAYVYFGGLNQKTIDDSIHALGDKAAMAKGMKFNVKDSKAVQDAADTVISEKGSCDILIAAAGIARSETPAEEVSDEHWLDVIDTNLNGLFWCCRSFGAHMLKAGKGSIINIGSMSGFIVNKPQPQSYYNASKAGVHHLTKSLAAEWGHRGVRVNALAPTYIETPLTKFGMERKDLYDPWLENTPMRRVGKPSEIASAALFLASEASSLMTGSIVVVDGGYTCW